MENNEVFDPVSAIYDIAVLLGRNGYLKSEKTCLKVMELLKKQDAKEIDLYGNDEWWGLVCICPDCKAEWMSDKAFTHFCPNCGRSVIWE